MFFNFFFNLSSVTSIVVGGRRKPPWAQVAVIHLQRQLEVKKCSNQAYWIKPCGLPVRMMALCATLNGKND